MLRRLPRRKRSANRLGGFLSVVISAVTFFFPLSGYANGPQSVDRYTWSNWSNVTTGPWCRMQCGPATAAIMRGNDGYEGYSVRYVRAREEQAVPLFGFRVYCVLWNFRGIGRSPERSLGRFGVCQACSVTRRKEIVSGNDPSVAPAETVGKPSLWPFAFRNSVVTFFFPLSGFEGHESYVEGWYYGSEQLGEYGASLTCYAGRALSMQPARSALCVRCVRAREEQAVPCFFPLSGSHYADIPIGGEYWSVSAIDEWFQYSGYVFGPSSVDERYALPAFERSVRCVRAREEQAVPLFWFKKLFVLRNFGGIGRSSECLAGHFGVCQACSVTLRKWNNFR